MHLDRKSPAFSPLRCHAPLSGITSFFTGLDALRCAAARDVGSDFGPARFAGAFTRGLPSGGSEGKAGGCGRGGTSLKASGVPRRTPRKFAARCIDSEQPCDQFFPGTVAGDGKIRHQLIAHVLAQFLLLWCDLPAAQRPSFSCPAICAVWLETPTRRVHKKTPTASRILMNSTQIPRSES